MLVKDRLSKLLDPSNTTLNGIDFVEIANPAQTTLRVHFLNDVSIAGSPPQTVSPTITGGETIPTVAVLSIDPATDWSEDADGRPLLTLHVAAPGDFSFYTLIILSDAIDPFYNHVQFSFKALCPSGLDCETPPSPCPPPGGTLPPITYLAKDFLSFRKALSDFSALQYPAWQERSEADFGVMFMEALCSLADDLSYTQDRIAAEATIDTATQRRSIVRLARLVDYDPQPALSSSVLLQLEVSGGPIPTSLLVSAPQPDGTQIDFETGTGLIDPDTLQLNVTTYRVNPSWNRFEVDLVTPRLIPYYWDDSQLCLKAGATEMWIEGQGYVFEVGMTLLIDTAAATTADPPSRETIQLVSVDEEQDPLYGDLITHIVWENGLQYNHDLSRTVLAGNIVPATQGRRYTESFAIDTVPVGSNIPLAMVRSGPNSTAQYLYSLLNTPLVWLQPSPDSSPCPEIILAQRAPNPVLPPQNWTWLSSLLDSQEFESTYTVDPMSYVPIRKNSDGTTSYDYAGDSGSTIRFGDDVFGEIPESGSTFQVTYRIGGGSKGNVAADTITKIDSGPNNAAASLINKVTNPFAAKGGADAETDQQVARLAPQAFRAVQYRAVLPADYEAAAETLPWVLRAGTVFRWTGSWLTVFTTADPKGTQQIPVDEHIELINLLNRYRLAGYESYVPSPDYVSIDLIVTVCALPAAFQGDVEAAVVSALSTNKFPNGTTGFFYYDNFTFGTPLELSALEAAIQSAYGVAGVVSVQYRQRGVTPTWTCLPDELQMGPNQILRMDNDPSQPNNGTLQVIVLGGK
ncbi:MAG TPA: baseplate J/gp47 family protein [Terriglobales bacterium]|nr:baseplate J/gp47 family protein [Terriglobales bacterium]